MDATQVLRAIPFISCAGIGDTLRQAVSNENFGDGLNQECRWHPSRPPLIRREAQVGTSSFALRYL